MGRSARRNFFTLVNWALIGFHCGPQVPRLLGVLENAAGFAFNRFALGEKIITVGGLGCPVWL